MARVALVGVHKSYGATPVVRGMDLVVEDGEVMALLGPSGCGKTTTLRMIAGLERPSEGAIHIGDVCVADAATFVPPEARHLGMVFQTYAVWPHRTVLDNVAYPLVLQRAADARARAVRALGQVHLDGLADRYPHQLSGGQQQRVALARALVAEPRVLLLDEPLSNLDAHLREEMRDEIRGLVTRTGVTVVVVTHDQEEALGLADHIAVMNDGVAEQIGTPEELYESPRTRFVAQFVGKRSLLDAASVPSDLVAGRVADARGDVVGIRPSRAGMVPGHVPGAIHGVVVAQVFLGPVRRTRVEVDGREVVVDQPERFDVGAPVSLRPDGALLL